MIKQRRDSQDEIFRLHFLSKLQLSRQSLSKIIGTVWKSRSSFFIAKVTKTTAHRRKKRENQTVSLLYLYTWRFNL